MINRHALLYLFDTCNLACGYCNLAKDGHVKDLSQLSLYRDKKNIDKIVGFFIGEHATQWRITLTGGEPLMMPNFDYFIDKLSARNSKISMFTNLTATKESQVFDYLLSNADRFMYIFATLQPEYIEHKDYFFEKVKLLKNAGAPIIVKLIMEPRLLHLLEDLRSMCEELDVSFMPMPLLTKNYPLSYTQLELNIIKRYFCTYKQVVHLFGGLDVSSAKCAAANEIIHVDARSGNIYPCADIYSQELKIGNIYDDKVEYLNKPTTCLKKEKICLCDIHYEDNILDILSQNISYLANGYTPMYPQEQIDKIIEKYKLRPLSHTLLDVREDESLVFEHKNMKELKKQVEILKKTCEERLELINYLHYENENRLQIILSLEETIKGSRR